MTFRDERTWSLYCGQVRTSQKRCEAQFFLNRELHTVQILPTHQTCVQFSNRTSVETLRPFPSGGNSASSCFSWHKVWTGVKCNFSSAHHPDWNVVGKLSIRRVRMWNFTRIGHQTKIVAFDHSAVWAAWLETTPKRCELQLFFAGIRQAARRWKVLDLGCSNMRFSTIG